MNFDLIDTFLILAKTGNFSRTAESLFISQSTVTARIKVLEEELGAELFVRDSKSVKLTDAGKAFREYALKLSKIMEDGRTTIKNLGKYKYSISLAAPDSVWQYSLLAPVNSFMDKNPEVAFRFFCGHSEYIISDIIEGIVDVGITFWKPYNAEMEIVPYFESEYELVAKPGLVPEGVTITPENISDYNLIYMDWGPNFEEWYKDYYQFNEFFLEVERVTLFVNLLLSGRGIGFLPGRSSSPYKEKGQLVNVPYKFMENAFVDKAYLLYLKKNREKVSPLVDWIIENTKC